MKTLSISKSTYYRVFGALMVLLALTAVMGFVHLGPFNLVASLAIAIAKATLIVLFFMHLRISSPLTRMFAIAGVFWLVIMLAFTLADYLTRTDVAIPFGP